MHIHQPEITKAAGMLRVSAQVEFDTPNLDLPDALYFELPETFEPLVAPGTEPFVTTLLTLPMLLNEKMTLRGSLSPRLHYGLREVQAIYNTWRPHAFHRIPIQPDAFAPLHPDPAARLGVASMFSGGLDSLYTLQQHLPDHEPTPSNRVTHAIFVRGLDMPLRQTSLYDTILPLYEAELQALGVTLITMSTNAQDFLVPIHQRLYGKSGFRYGIIYNAVAMLLGRGIHRLVVPAGLHLKEYTEFGQHPFVTPPAVTETLTAYQHGTDKTRFEKTQAIAHWQPAHRMLRVCLDWSRGGRERLNCCNCSKCVGTMLRLDMAGVLDRCETFPDPLTGAKIRRMYRPNQPHILVQDHILLRQLLPAIRAQRRWDVLLNLLIAIVTRPFRRVINKLRPPRYQRTNH